MEKKNESGALNEHHAVKWITGRMSSLSWRVSVFDVVCGDNMMRSLLAT